MTPVEHAASSARRPTTYRATSSGTIVASSSMRALSRPTIPSSGMISPSMSGVDARVRQPEHVDLVLEVGVVDVDP
jgi:hypothetical protein